MSVNRNVTVPVGSCVMRQQCSRSPRRGCGYAGATPGRVEAREADVLLSGRNAVIYGASGSVGGAVARAFAGEGARVFLTARTAARLDRIADEITAAGGHAETAEVDALDEASVERHIERVVDQVGCVDISFNAIG